MRHNRYPWKQDLVTMETGRSTPRGHYFFLGELLILKVNILGIIKMQIEFYHKGGAWEPILAAKLVG